MHTRLLYPLVLLAFPLGEFLIFRILLHSVFGMRIGYRGFTDYDYLIPGAFAYICLMLSLQRSQPLTLRPQKRFIIWNVCLGVFFLSYNAAIVCFSGWHVYGGPAKRILRPVPWTLWAWYPIAFAFIGSAFFLFVSPSYFARRTDRKLIAAAWGITLSKIVGRHLFSVFWAPVARATGVLSYEVLAQILPKMSYRLLQEGPDKIIYLDGPYFTLAVGVGCSGLEGVFFALSCLLFVFIFNQKLFSSSEWLALAVSTSMLMYVVNILRVCVFFLISVLGFSYLGHWGGILVALSLFHDFLGWGIYFAVIYFAVQWAMRPVASSSTNPLRLQRI